MRHGSKTRIIDKDDGDNNLKYSKGSLSGTVSKTIKGAFIGMIIILPGISGGTVLFALGLYEDLMKDLAHLRLMPWLPFLIGAGAGILVSGWVFNWLFVKYTAVILAFLLGCILASIKAVLGKDFHPDFKRMVSLVIGLAAGLALAGMSDFGTGDASTPGILSLLVGGALASVTMILPGVPGNLILIIMGIYDDLLHALAELEWITLIIFAIGSVMGIVGLSNILDKIYARYRDMLNWLFAGLIIGTGRMMIPDNLDNPVLFILVAVLGFVLVWKWDMS